MKTGRIFNFFISISLNIVIILAIILFTPGLPPNVRYVSYTLTPPTGFEGKYAENNILDKAEIFLSGDIINGPESIAIRGDELFTGLNGGRIVRISKNGNVQVITTVKGDCGNEYWKEGKNCGRVLGLRFDRHGKLVFVDSVHGIYRLDVDTGDLEELVSTNTLIDGKKPRIPDDLDIDREGNIYWTDASTICSLRDGLIELLSSGTGRVIQYDPKTESSTILMDRLHFPNGIQLSFNQDFLLVAESFRARVLRYFLKGPRQGEQEVLVDGLPGIPDNIRSTSHGTYYITLVVPRTDHNPAPGDKLGRLPLIRKLILRFFSLLDLMVSFLNRLFPGIRFLEKASFDIWHIGMSPMDYPKKVTIVEISESGEILRTLQTQNSEMHTVTETTEGHEYTYFGSFSEKKLWRIKNKHLRRT